MALHSEASPTRLTRGHQRVHDVLTDLGLVVEDEVPAGVYTIDMYVREFHVAVEFDGPHHLRPKQKRHDRDRDAWLEEYAALPVFRVSHVTDGLSDALRAFMEEHAETTGDRYTVARRAGIIQ